MASKPRERRSPHIGVARRAPPWSPFRLALSANALRPFEGMACEPRRAAVGVQLGNLPGQPGRALFPCVPRAEGRGLRVPQPSPAREGDPVRQEDRGAGSPSLKQRGLITVTPQWAANGRQTSNRYTLTMAKEGVTGNPLPPVSVTPSPRCQRPPGGVTVTLPLEMGNVNGHIEMGKGNGHCNSRPPRRVTAGAVDTAGDVPFPEELSLVPQTDDEQLQELVKIYVAERGLQPWCLKPLYGYKLADHVLDAWDQVGEHGDVPDDLPATFRRVVRLYAETPTFHSNSFASILLRYSQWELDLEAYEDEEDIPIPSYAPTHADLTHTAALAVPTPPTPATCPTRTTRRGRRTRCLLTSCSMSSPTAMRYRRPAMTGREWAFRRGTSPPPRGAS